MSKHLDNAKKQFDTKKIYPIQEAIEIVKKVSYEKFDPSLRISFSMNLNPKHSEQNIRGSIVLPGGTGKTKKILAIVEDADVEKATKAGADFIGGEEMLTKIQRDNWFEFDIIVTTPTLMPKFAKFGKLLGTKGLMPNPKLGTVSAKIEKAIEDIKKGSVEYKVDSAGVINILFGKKSFSTESLLENFKTIFQKIKTAKPSTVKGDYFKTLHISSTMGPSVKVEIEK